MNVNARLSRSNLNLNHKQTPHFHRSYHNINVIDQQYTPPPRPPPAAAVPTTILNQPQYEQQQQQINDPYSVTQYDTEAAAGKIYQQQNQWFRNNDKQCSQINYNNNNNNNNNNNWNKHNAYDTPNFVPASFWMGAERFVYPTMKQDSSSAATWQPQIQQQQHQQQKQQRGNILDYKNQSNTVYSVYNHNVKRQKAVTGNGTNGVITTIQPVIKVRTNMAGLPYTPQPERRNTVNEQRAIQAVMPLNDTFLNERHQTS